MAISIKNAEAERLVRRLASVTGESMTTAVLVSIRERLAREEAARRPGPHLAARLDRLTAEVAELAVLDDRPADALVGYDDHGLPT
jgi:antitoxin VapB